MAAVAAAAIALAILRAYSCSWRGVHAPAAPSCAYSHAKGVNPGQTWGQVINDCQTHWMNGGNCSEGPCHGGVPGAVAIGANRLVFAVVFGAANDDLAMTVAARAGAQIKLCPQPGQHFALAAHMQALGYQFMKLSWRADDVTVPGVNTRRRLWLFQLPQMPVAPIGFIVDDDDWNDMPDANDHEHDHDDERADTRRSEGSAGRGPDGRAHQENPAAAPGGMRKTSSRKRKHATTTKEDDKRRKRAKRRTMVEGKKREREESEIIDRHGQARQLSRGVDAFLPASRPRKQPRHNPPVQRPAAHHRKVPRKQPKPQYMNPCIQSLTGYATATAIARVHSPTIQQQQTQQPTQQQIAHTPLSCNYKAPRLAPHNPSTRYSPQLLHQHGLLRETSSQSQLYVQPPQFHTQQQYSQACVLQQQQQQILSQLQQQQGQHLSAPMAAISRADLIPLMAPASETSAQTEMRRMATTITNEFIKHIRQHLLKTCMDIITEGCEKIVQDRIAAEKEKEAAEITRLWEQGRVWPQRVAPMGRELSTDELFAACLGG